MDQILDCIETTDNAAQDKPKPKLKGPWLFFAVAIPLSVLLIGSVFGLNKIANDSDICKSCHEVGPEYYTWQASAHSQVECTGCHAPVNPAARLARNFMGLRQVFLHFTGKYETPIKISQPISNENCLSCHSKNRSVSPSGDIVISHVLHDQNGVQCINCHLGVAHGQIVERGRVAEVKPQEWTEMTGKLEAANNYTKPKMLQCLQCHRQWKVSTQCEKCHKKIPTPASHQPQKWRELHGEEAWRDVNQCSQCHYDSRLADATNKLDVAWYVRSNSFCYSCHLKFRPPSHIDTWPHDHSFHVVRNEIPYCITCHDVEQRKDGELNGTSTYCNKCHGKYYVGQHRVEGI